jgi:signal transduction histidine kinase
VRVPLLVALLLLLAAALTASLVPAGAALDRRVEAELRRVAVEDLGRAPMILEDRNAQRAEALSMHAMTVAGVAGLADAVRVGQLDRAASMARTAAAMYGEQPVVVSGDGRVFVGPGIGDDALAALRRGESRVEYVYQDGVPRAVGLVALESGGKWVGAVGSERLLDASLATTLSALARADVTLLGADGALVATTLDTLHARALGVAVRDGRGRPETEKVRAVDVAGELLWVAGGSIGPVATVLFSRSASKELAALPGVRRGALLAGLLTLGLALAVGTLVAVALARPVRGLAQAAARVSEGDFDAPVPHSRLEEIDRLGSAFRVMRENLRGRLEELAEANRALEERQQRLRDLQAELIRQDRLASSARMAAELAHEIRNPVANVRNCLEVVRRGLPDGSEGSRFADMAIDELLRMHELAENLLDLNRPSDPSQGTCDPVEVAEQVATLAGVGEAPVRVTVRVDAAPEVRMSVPPDALKQILFNLVENAREAGGGGEGVEIRVTTIPDGVRLDVLDRGPGIPDDALPKLFDPFFTTKHAVHGVGLGLFVAEGLARRYGGRMEASNRVDGPGARFTVEAPLAGREART